MNLPPLVSEGHGIAEPQQAVDAFDPSTPDHLLISGKCHNLTSLNVSQNHTASRVFALNYLSTDALTDNTIEYHYTHTLTNTLTHTNRAHSKHLSLPQFYSNTNTTTKLFPPPLPIHKQYATTPIHTHTFINQSHPLNTRHNLTQSNPSNLLKLTLMPTTPTTNPSHTHPPAATTNSLPRSSPPPHPATMNQHNEPQGMSHSNSLNTSTPTSA
jgi:hypothetical protein